MNPDSPRFLPHHSDIESSLNRYAGDKKANTPIPDVLSPVTLNL